MEIRAYLGLSGKELPIQYWRTKNGYEVDLVVGNKAALEIKAAKQVGSGHIKGLSALKEEGLIENYAVISLDTVTRDMVPGIKAVYWKEFLDSLWSGRSWFG